MRRARNLSLLATALVACGPAAPVKPQGPSPCAAGETQLRARVGPELGLVVNKIELALPAPSADGCALVYTLVGEEMSGEVFEEVTPDAAGDHQLAIALPGAAGQSLNLVEPSKTAPGEATLLLKLQDVTSSGQVELVVQADKGFGSDGYRGLRIFDYARGDGVPHPVFDEQLTITTPEGLSLIPEWKTGAVGARRAIFLDGAGTMRVFTWDGAARRFVFDEAETAKRAPKPKPAPVAVEAPVPPGEAAPAAPVEETKADGKKGDEKKDGNKKLAPLDLDL